MTLWLFFFFTTCVSVFSVHGELVIVRKKSGDKVYGRHRSCKNEGTFYWRKITSHSARHCIRSSEDIGCQLYFHDHDDEIPTLNIKRSAVTLEVDLPWHENCQNTIMKLQYWNYKNGKSVFSTSLVKEIRKTIHGSLHEGDEWTFPMVGIVAYHKKLLSKDVNVKVQASLKFNRQLPGLLLKLSFGCREDGRKVIHKDDCLLIKFKGVAKYPLTKDYFNTVISPKPMTTPSASTTTLTTTKETTTTTTTSTTIQPESTEEPITPQAIHETSTGTNPFTTSEQSGKFGGRNGSRVTTKPPVIITTSIKHNKQSRVKRAVAIMTVFLLAILVLVLLTLTFFYKKTACGKKAPASHEKQSLLGTGILLPPNHDGNINGGFNETHNPVYDQMIGVTPGLIPLFSPFDRHGVNTKAPAYDRLDPNGGIYCNVPEHLPPPPYQRHRGEERIGSDSVFRDEDEELEKAKRNRVRSLEGTAIMEESEPSDEDTQPEQIYEPVAEEPVETTEANNNDSQPEGIYDAVAEEPVEMKEEPVYAKVDKSRKT